MYFNILNNYLNKLEDETKLNKFLNDFNIKNYQKKNIINNNIYLELDYLNKIKISTISNYYIHIFYKFFLIFTFI